MSTSNHRLDKKNHAPIHDLLYAKGIDWATLDDRLQNRTYPTRDGTARSDVLPVYAAIEAILLDQLATREETAKDWLCDDTTAPRKPGRCLLIPYRWWHRYHRPEALLR